MEAPNAAEDVEVVSILTEPSEPVAAETESVPAAGTEAETTEPESAGTEIEPAEAGSAGIIAEPAGKIDEVPKILGDMNDRIKKIHDRFGYLQRQVETLRQEPVKPMEPEKPIEQPKPKEEDFEEYNEFIDALTDWKVDAKIEALNIKAQKKAIDSRTAESEKKFRAELNTGGERYSDFEEVAMSPTVPITEAMVQILHECEHPADIAYYFGKHIKECAAVANMTPFRAAKAIGKIEAEINAELKKSPPETKITKAPEPIKPIKSREIITKDPDKMTQKEYEVWRRGR